MTIKYLHLTLCNITLISLTLISTAITQGKELQVWQKSVAFADDRFTDSPPDSYREHQLN